MTAGEWSMDDPIAEPSFRGPEVCELAGISYRQLDYWTRTGLIWSSIAQASGSGTQRLWSREDIAYIRLIRELLDLGVALPRIRAMSRELRLSIDTRDEKPFLVATTSDAQAVTGEELLDVVRNSVTTIALSLDEVCALDDDRPFAAEAQR